MWKHLRSWSHDVSSESFEVKLTDCLLLLFRIRFSLRARQSAAAILVQEIWTITSDGCKCGMPLNAKLRLRSHFNAHGD